MEWFARDEEKLRASNQLALWVRLRRRCHEPPATQADARSLSAAIMLRPGPDNPWR